MNPYQDVNRNYRKFSWQSVNGLCCPVHCSGLCECISVVGVDDKIAELSISASEEFNSTMRTPNLHVRPDFFYPFHTVLWGIGKIICFSGLEVYSKNFTCVVYYFTAADQDFPDGGGH